MAAIMVLAGDTFGNAMSKIAEKRCIDASLVTHHNSSFPLQEEFVQTSFRLECYEFILKAVKNIGTPIVSIVPEERTQPTQLHSRCATCHKRKTNLRECWECSRKECGSCSFWCTFCPDNKFEKYVICSLCNSKGLFLMRHKNRWSCYWCWYSYFPGD